MKKLAVSSLILCSAMASVAANATNEIEGNFSVHAGLTYGGDDLSTLEYDNGDKVDITAGGLALLGVGYNINFSEQISVKINGSYHFDNASAKNGDITFSRFELEAIPYYSINNKVRLGLGAAYHTAVDYNNDFDSNIDTKFDSSVGFILSGDYQLDNDMGKLELRYVSIDYNIDKIGDYSVKDWDLPSIDGDHFGVLYHWVF